MGPQWSITSKIKVSVSNIFLCSAYLFSADAFVFLPVVLRTQPDWCCFLCACSCLFVFVLFVFFCNYVNRCSAVILQPCLCLCGCAAFYSFIFLYISICFIFTLVGAHTSQCWALWWLVTQGRGCEICSLFFATRLCLRGMTGFFLYKC